MTSLSYPFKAENGKLVLATGLLELKHQVIYLLRTRIGERVLRQSFGLPDYLFEASTRTNIESEITQQILKFFPLVSEVITEASRDDSGNLRLTLSLTVNEENIPPFVVVLENNQ